MSAGLRDPATLRVASYNIHKGIGLDRRRDPERILRVLREIDADVVALQEADRRFGSRAAALPRQMIDALSDYRAVPLDTRPDSIGWHGNALLVRKGTVVRDAAIVPLPTLEPRGAICATLEMAGAMAGRRVRIVGMHLDISGLRRRQQVRTIMAHVAGYTSSCPAVLMGDLNEWSVERGAMAAFGPGYVLLAPGRSFHARRPVAQLDRIVVSAGVETRGCGVHHSAAAAVASDHLPVWADLAPWPPA